MNMMNLKKLLLMILVLITITALTVSPTALQAEEQEALPEFENTYTLAEASWPGIEAKNEVIRQVLEEIGYDLETEFLGVPMIFHGFSDGDIDLWFGSWMPGEAAMREGHEGSFEVVRTHIDDALYISAVPEYVYEAGVTSHEDLEEYADRFDHTIHAGPPGEGADEAISHAVEEDIYGLGDWEIINAEWPATVAEAESAMEDEEWIVFPGWQPHWMNVILDLKYLEDPEGIWGEAESDIQTLTGVDLSEEAPNLYRFAENFEITSADQSEWIFEYDREGREMENIAAEWIGENLDIVTDWFEGMEAKTGEPAKEVIREAF